ncbi:MAG: adenine phosphoribosyltransferase [Gammaproteobacteria bacterium]
MQDIAARIRDIPDFPSPGIVFKDLTPVMRDARLLRAAAEELARPFLADDVTVVLGMEARGFIFGSLVAAELAAGFVPLRKPGKLPWLTHRVAYDLEYGSAALEMHRDAVGPGDRVLLVDDLIATGGTAAASLALAAQNGATVIGAAFVVELDFLNGRRALGDCRVHALVHY